MPNLDANNSPQPFDQKLTDLAKNIPGAALTGKLTTMTFSAPGTPNYATSFATSGYCFVDSDTANTLIKVIANIQARQNDVESRLQAAKIIS